MARALAVGGSFAAIFMLGASLASGGASPPDRTDPVIRLSGDERQKLGKRVRVTVRANEACTVVGRGTLSVGGYRLRKAPGVVPEDGRERLALKIPRKARHATAQALEAGKRVVAKLKVTAADAAGNTTTKTRKVRLKR